MTVSIASTPVSADLPQPAARSRPGRHRAARHRRRGHLRRARLRRQRPRAPAGVGRRGRATPRTTAACTAAPGTCPSCPPTCSRTPAGPSPSSSTAAPDDQVIFTRSTTDSPQPAGRGAAPRGRQVFVFETEHHASLLPCGGRRGCTYLDAPRTPSQAVADAGAGARRAGSPTARPLACVTGASNVTGELWPVRELAAAAHAHGARIVLDAAQLAPHHPVPSCGSWTSTGSPSPGTSCTRPSAPGVLAGRADWLSAGRARTWRAAAPRRRSTRRADGGVDVEWHESAARHEAGSPNVIGAYSIASACKALTEAGFDTPGRPSEQLIANRAGRARRDPEGAGAALFGDDAPRVGVHHPSSPRAGTARTWPPRSPPSTASGCATALFCAHPLVCTLARQRPADQGECGASRRPRREVLNAIRVSFGAGTPDEHVERFAVRASRANSWTARWNYRTVEGRCVPAVWIWCVPRVRRLVVAATPALGSPAPGGSSGRARSVVGEEFEARTSASARAIGAAGCR